MWVIKKENRYLSNDETWVPIQDIENIKFFTYWMKAEGMNINLGGEIISSQQLLLDMVESEEFGINKVNSLQRELDEANINYGNLLQLNTRLMEENEKLKQSFEPSVSLGIPRTDCNEPDPRHG